MKSLIVAGALAAVLGAGLMSPGAAEAGHRHSRSCRHGQGYSHRYSSGHNYRPYYRPQYRTYYRPYYRPYYYAPPAYYGVDPYYNDYNGYGGGYCRRPSAGVGFYYGY